VGRSPWGDPSAYRIRGAVIAIRRADAADILVIPRARDAE
jgi:Fe2+ transport system protein FeoA